MNDRLLSLDAFRGLTIAGMILVNNPGSWAYVYAPLAHAAWHGWTPTDLIFPYFLFIVGVAIPFSLGRRLEGGAARGTLFRQAARRSVLLIALGLAMRAVPDFDFADMRLYGVLQRIGLVYAAAAALYLWGSRRARSAALAALLLGYWALLAWLPVPGFGAGDLSPDGNAAAWLDRLIMGDRLWQDTWDPEGLLSTLPAVATCLCGIFCGEGLRAARARSGAAAGDAAAGDAAGGGEHGAGRVAGAMLAWGAGLAALGLAWDQALPINKNLWTSSYATFTAGTALLLFGAMYWAIDARGWRRWWVAPLVAFGMNAIAVFVASGMFAKTLARIRVGDADGTPLSAWLYESLFRSWAGDYGGSLAFALAQVAFWLCAMWILHRRGIHFKV